MKVTPSKLPGEMPPQSLSVCKLRKAVSSSAVRSRGYRRVIVLGGATLLTAFAVNEMHQVFAVGDTAWTEYIVVALFGATFFWIALACVSGLFGFGLRIVCTKKPKMKEKVESKNVILIPTYNENTAHVFAAIEAMANGLIQNNAGLSFDWFVLSDTTEPDIFLQEEEAVRVIQKKLQGKANVFYRRRRENIGKKAGNVQDFCVNWGRLYDHMVVLDADSLMEGETIIELARRMEACPDTGLIQTIPCLIRGKTLMARLQQFANRIYGPVIGTGLAWWADKDGNFWGHNAIIRVSAFMEAAGLPVLPGKPPFGGHVLSHDFVEAAFLRRAGWVVDIAWDLQGSYEESPPSLLDMAVRDRRWCQGNMQHTRILFSKGLTFVSRMHMVTGIMSFMCSPLWLMLVLAGFAMALQTHFVRPEYFPATFSLFPVWPILDAERALRLFAVTMSVLFCPKFLGVIDNLCRRSSRKILGGGWQIVKSALTEVILSALIAPVMMLIHTGAVWSILSGRDSGWSAQRRDDGSLPWSTVIYKHRVHTCIGLLMAVGATFHSGQLLAWMMPAIIGMLLAIPLSYCTARKDWGEWFQHKGLLVTPEEVSRPYVLQEMEELLPWYQEMVKRTPRVKDLIQDKSCALRRTSFIIPVPQHLRGVFTTREAQVVAKWNDVRNAEDILEFMNKDEQAWILSTPQYYKQLLELIPQVEPV
ncbi:glucans biosynthesis glucosyltransferase MdoH [Desulfogranum japonicum]|uniref:glucans biosynthesis glucosyltransferase MdoH n=1 Tax=Desulfogranum japonicum TaxID=231447 RepID=UPI00048BD10B|nr:glucans biosynthesis glucosyltransferase MdoH [Desulfogranum japonicum]